MRPRLVLDTIKRLKRIENFCKASFVWFDYFTWLFWNNNVTFEMIILKFCNLNGSALNRKIFNFYLKWRSKWKIGKIPFWNGLGRNGIIQDMQTKHNLIWLISHVVHDVGARNIKVRKIITNHLRKETIKN